MCFAIYQQLKESGYTDDHIVLIVEDDIARNPSNPNNGADQGHSEWGQCL